MRRYLSFLFFFLFAGFSFSLSVADRQDKFNRLFRADVSPTEVLFQSFGWDSKVNGQGHVWYRNLQTKARELSEAGITHVWYPPVSRSVAQQGYLPGDWYDLGEGEELGHNRTFYGNRQELISSIQEMKRYGIKPVADVVINHRCASHQDENGVWNIFHHKSGKALWEKWALVRGSFGGTGSPDTGDVFPAAPDIDHTNKAVQADIVKYLLWLKNEIGFEGWRFDYVKGFDGFFVKKYVEESGVSFAVGEYWTSMAYGKELMPDQNAHRKELMNWIDRTEGASTAFDFTTKGILQEACQKEEYWRLRDSEGRAAGALGWWPEKSVTFIDNHDTGSKQAHWPFPGEKVLEGYAYILTHPGMPSVFWEHFYEWGDFHREKIRELIKLRHEQGLHKSSELIIHVAEQGLYVAETDSRVLLKMGSRNWEADEGWKSRLSGPGYQIWTR
jgi:alpha-amylase